IINLIIRKSIKQIPAYRNPCRSCIAQQVYILPGCYSLAHELQQAGGEGFDSGLNKMDAGLAQSDNFSQREVGLLLIKNLQAGLRLGQLRQQRIEVAVWHDIVNHEDTLGMVSAGHVSNVTHNAR